MALYINGAKYLEGAQIATSIFTFLADIAVIDEVILGADDGGAVGPLTGGTVRAAHLVGGTTSNVAGADLTIEAGQGTGTGDAGRILFKTPRVGSSGTTVHTLTTFLTLDEAAAILGTGEGGVVACSDGYLRAPDNITGAGDDDIAGADLYISGGRGRGAGDVSQIIFRCSAVAVADTRQTYVTALTLDGPDATFGGTVQLNDDIALKLGTGGTAQIKYNTDDADANVLMFLGPESGGVDVPVFVFGDPNADKELTWFNGISEPTLAIIDDDADSFVNFGFGWDDHAQIIVGGSSSHMIEIGSHNVIGSGAVVAGFECVGETIARVGAAIKFVATEDFSSTATGSKLEFYTVDDTTIVQDLRLTIDEDGSATFTGSISDVNGVILSSDYAGIKVYHQAVETTVNYQYVWEIIDKFDADMPEVVSNGAHGTNNITVGASGDYKVHLFGSGAGAGADTFGFSVFEVSATVDATVQSNTEANPGVFTFTATHPFSTDDKVKFTGLNNITEYNDKIFTVVDTGATTITLKDENGGAMDTTGLGIANTGTATLVTELRATHAHRKWANNDIGSFGGSGIATLTKDNTLEAWFQNATGTNNFTVEVMSFYIQRLG